MGLQSPSPNTIINPAMIICRIQPSCANLPFPVKLVGVEKGRNPAMNGDGEHSYIIIGPCNWPRRTAISDESFSFKPCLLTYLTSTISAISRAAIR